MTFPTTNLSIPAIAYLTPSANLVASFRNRQPHPVHLNAYDIDGGSGNTNHIIRKYAA
jgi:hypothetical protein